MTDLGIGVIGLGRMGRIYGYHVARQVKGARLVAVADTQTEATSEVAAQISGVRAYADYTDLLADDDIQGIIIATPTSTHYDSVIAADEAKKAIFCE